MHEEMGGVDVGFIQLKFELKKCGDYPFLQKAFGRSKDFSKDQV